MTLNWFLSKTVRHALAMCKHVEKLLNHQKDILSAKAVEEVRDAVSKLRQTASETLDKAALAKEMENLETVANKWIKPYPNAAWRENVEVLLVALAVAMGVRTFFLQPFKIPTGSMQPTLFGVTSENLRNQPHFRIPTGWERVKQWFEGISYLQITAKEDGTFEGADPPVRLLIFNIYQRIHFAGRVYSIWFPPDWGAPPFGTLEMRAGLTAGQEFHKGEDIVRLATRAGDHLFVDRLTYNFRPPKRGEIIVFETKGIPAERRETDCWQIPPDQFYIKRLVGIPGDRIQIGNDRHLIINGKRLDASTPHFDRVYRFNPDEPPRESHYSGHLNEAVISEYLGQRRCGPDMFPNQTAVYNVSSNHFVVMGDNTMNSLDSRYWGEFKSTSVIGRALFVYWPLSERFGWECVNH